MEKNYFSGILGALIGGLIASVPWILLYVYADIMYSFLTIFIAIGAVKGYELFNGKIDKKLPIIISIISIISITVVTLVIIPCLLLLKSRGTLTLVDFKILYSSSEFVTAIIKDYIFSILFTALGISGVIANIKKQTSNGETPEKIKIDISNGNNKKDRDYLKNIFINQGSINKENAILLPDDEKINENTLNLLISQGLIIKEENKYYYSLEQEEKLIKNNKKVLWITFSIITFILLLLFILMLANNKVDNKSFTTTTTTAKIQEITRELYYNIPETYEEYEEDGKIYLLPLVDLTGDSGYIRIDSYEGKSKYDDDFLEGISENFNKDYGYNVTNKKHYKTSLNNDVAMLEITDDGYKQYLYYVFGPNRTAIIGVYDNGKYSSITNDAEKLIDTLEFNSRF